MLEKYPKDVKVVFKNFPLRNHQFSQEAALSALAAGEQGKFWDFHNEIFANYNKLNNQKIEEIAQKVGLDMEKYHQDKKDPKLIQAISHDMKEGIQAGVRGTPTLFVNGRLLKNRSLQGFQELIDKDLAKRNKKQSK